MIRGMVKGTFSPARVAAWEIPKRPKADPIYAGSISPLLRKQRYPRRTIPMHRSRLTNRIGSHSSAMIQSSIVRLADGIY
jgi:hypothetical protein